MDIKEQVFAYLIDIEEDSAAELIRESEFRVFTEDVVMTEFEEWNVCSYQILIKAKFLKEIEAGGLNEEKKQIEKALIKFGELEQQVVRYIAWYPLPRIFSEVSKYNQNDRLKQYLIEGNLDGFFTNIRSVFASLSYQMKVTEAYFHSNIHVILKIIGFNIESEDETNLGRIDSVIELDDTIYIIEFKNSSSDIAIEQIKNKKYYEKYLIKRKSIFMVGVHCSLIERNVVDWKVEKYNA